MQQRRQTRRSLAQPARRCQPNAARLIAVGLALAAASAARAGTLDVACGRMTAMAWPHTDISEAQWQPADGDLPAHCMMRATIGGRRDESGRAFGVMVELRLPADWNGRFLFQGGGGLDGVVAPAVGLVNGGKPGLARGFAVVSMDGGHEGRDAGFASDQQARLDFAYQAIGTATGFAKAAIVGFYRAPITHSYFVGCSNGGREAMMAVDRFPLEFDGVVAGDPGFRLAHAALGEAWNDVQFARIAPRDEAGRPDLARALSDAELTLLADAVMAECDGLDGLRDGLISNPDGCHFSPRRLRCGAGQAAGCLSEAKIAAIEAVFAGAHDGAGRALYSGFPYDSGIGQPGWRQWVLGSEDGGRSLNETLGVNSLGLYFMTPAQPGLDVFRIDFDRAERAVAQTAAIDDAAGTLLSSFAGHGGRLLIYQGMSDPVFSARDIQDWYDDLRRGDAHATAYARLFRVPGMTHCGGGIATDSFDPLAAVQDWVEHGTAPERIVATGAALPGVARPLCAYPKYARYGGGDARDAAHFSCVAEKGE